MDSYQTNIGSPLGECIKIDKVLVTLTSISSKTYKVKFKLSSDHCLHISLRMGLEL